jgi:hypothetical protein
MRDQTRVARRWTIALGGAVALLTAGWGVIAAAQEDERSCTLETAISIETYPAEARVTVTWEDRRDKYRCDGTTGKWARL